MPIDDSHGTRDANFEGHALFSRIIDAIPDALIVVNTSGKALVINAAARELLGVKELESPLLNIAVDNLFELREPTSGNRIWLFPEFYKELVDGYEFPPKEFLCSTQRFSFRLHIRANVLEGTHPEVILIFFSKTFLSKNIAPSEHIVQSIYQGQVVGIEKVLTEIAERKKVELALKKSQETIRQILDLIPHLIYAKNIEGRFLLVNRAVSESVNKSVEEITGRLSRELTPDPDEYERMAADDRMVIETGKRVIARQETLTDHEGKKRWLETTKIPYVTVDGEQAVLGLSIDITDKKKLEEQLIHSERMQALGQLAGGIAHDINNQLAGISGYAEVILLESQNNPKISDYSAKLLHSVKRASDLTAQFMAFARKGEYTFVPVDLNTLVEEVIDLLERTIDKRIVLRRTLSIEPLIALGDPSQIQNAIMNVALNARDAMPEGGELLCVTNAVYLEGPLAAETGSFIGIEIGDSGIGIPEEIQKRIFEPFFTTKEPGRGTGMGLATTYSTIKNHNGFIRIRSGVGRGTTISLFLPQSKLLPLSQPEQPEIQANTSVHKKILFVDDENCIERSRFAAAREPPNSAFQKVCR